MDIALIKNDIRQILADILNVDINKIPQDANFVQDLGLDSMMALELFAGMEKKYKIVIPEEMYENFISINNTTEIIYEIVKKK